MIAVSRSRPAYGRRTVNRGHGTHDRPDASSAATTDLMGLAWSSGVARGGSHTSCTDLSATSTRRDAILNTGTSDSLSSATIAGKSFCVAFRPLHLLMTETVGRRVGLEGRVQRGWSAFPSLEEEVRGRGCGTRWSCATSAYQLKAKKQVFKVKEKTLRDDLAGFFCSL